MKRLIEISAALAVTAIGSTSALAQYNPALQPARPGYVDPKMQAAGR
jgi:hypothetical protein